MTSLYNVLGFDKVLSDMAQHWNKFHGGKFQLKYASDLISEGKMIKSFELNDLSNDLRRIYDISIELIEDGIKKTRKLELKNWSNFYPETIQNQFIKDLAKMENLGEVQWIFNKTSGISDIGILKGKVITAP